MTLTRILHFIDTLAAGGAERQLVYLLERLDREQYECHVLTIYDHFRHYEPTLTQLGIPLYSLHHGALTPTNRVQAVAGYVRLMWHLRPQIVHGWLHYPNLIARAARPACPPHRLITAMRSSYTVQQRRSESLTGWLSDFRIVNHLNLNQKNYLPNGIALEQFEQNCEQSLRTTLTPNTDLLLLVPTRIDPVKDHHTILEALSQTQNISILLIGEVTNTNTQKLIQQSITAQSLQDRIIQLPPTHTIAPYYHAADATLLASRAEGFPNVILESFAAGKPVIVSEAANAISIVQDNLNGWTFKTGDAKSLAECLSTVQRTPQQQRLEMGQNGHEIATQYSVEIMVKRYTDLYERALRHS